MEQEQESSGQGGEGNPGRGMTRKPPGTQMPVERDNSDPLDLEPDDPEWSDRSGNTRAAGGAGERSPAAEPDAGSTSNPDPVEQGTTGLKPDGGVPPGQKPPGEGSTGMDQRHGE